MSGKRALIGLHDSLDRNIFPLTVRDKGYSTDVVSTPEEMREHAKENKYDLYVMDVNLGNSGSCNFKCALKIQKLIDEQLKVGTEFIPLSSSCLIVSQAKKEGLPAIEKIDFSSRLDEIVNN